MRSDAPICYAVQLRGRYYKFPGMTLTQARRIQARLLREGRWAQLVAF